MKLCNNRIYKGKLRIHICKYCNSEFSTYKDDSVYCSRDCESKFKTKPKVSLICDNCNITYKVYPSAEKWSKLREYKKNFCSKDCLYNYYSGENHPYWIDDRNKLKDNNKSIRWGKDMNAWRKQIFKRDGYCCQICHEISRKGYPIELNAHHIKSFKDYPKERFNIDNGITLCSACHVWVHHLNPLDFQ